MSKILLLLISMANASFHFKDEVKIDKSCFISLRKFKCESYKYMIMSRKTPYKIGPGKAETVPTPCLDNAIKEQCITLVKKGK
jgi:hypothetical protein